MLVPRSEARELVMKYGWNATAYQILNPGIEYWFAPESRAVVGYTRRRHVLLVAGAPVCPDATLPSVIEKFEAYARESRGRVCYVCAESRLRDLLSRMPTHAAVAIGAQPAWNPQEWARIVAARASLRSQLSRARNKGVVVEKAPPERAAADPALRAVLNEWLRTRTLPPLHFLVEPCTLDGEVSDRLVLIARRDGAPVAYLVASPVAARNGYLVEQVARSPRAPNGASELLIDSAMRIFAREGRTFATLGLVALASRVWDEIAANPAWMRLMMTMARAHTNRFYNFRGLEQFRMKMAPREWEPIYAISNENRFSITSLYAVGEAFAGIAPWRAVCMGVLRAVVQEVRNARRFVAGAIARRRSRLRPRTFAESHLRTRARRP
jgi:phosphatidylglycerol lysyltransferase